MSCSPGTFSASFISLAPCLGSNRCSSFIVSIPCFVHLLSTKSKVAAVDWAVLRSTSHPPMKSSFVSRSQSYTSSLTRPWHFSNATSSGFQFGFKFCIRVSVLQIIVPSELRLITQYGSLLPMASFAASLDPERSIRTVFGPSSFSNAGAAPAFASSSCFFSTPHSCSDMLSFLSLLAASAAALSAFSRSFSISPRIHTCCTLSSSSCFCICCDCCSSISHFVDPFSASTRALRASSSCCCSPSTSFSSPGTLSASFLSLSACMPSTISSNRIVSIPPFRPFSSSSSYVTPSAARCAPRKSTSHLPIRSSRVIESQSYTSTLTCPSPILLCGTTAAPHSGFMFRSSVSLLYSTSPSDTRFITK